MIRKHLIPLFVLLVTVAFFINKSNMPLPEQQCSTVDHCATQHHHAVSKKAVKSYSLVKKYKKKFKFKGSEVRYDMEMPVIAFHTSETFAKPVFLTEYSIPPSSYKSSRQQRGPPALLS